MNDTDQNSPNDEKNPSKTPNLSASSNHVSVERSQGLQYYDRFFAPGRRRGIVSAATAAAKAALPRSTKSGKHSSTSVRHNYLSLALEDDGEGEQILTDDGVSIIQSHHPLVDQKSYQSSEALERREIVDASGSKASSQSSLTRSKTLRGFVEQLNGARRRYSRVSSSEARSDSNVPNGSSPTRSASAHITRPHKLTNSDIEMGPMLSSHDDEEDEENELCSYCQKSNDTLSHSASIQGDNEYYASTNLLMVSDDQIELPVIAVDEMTHDEHGTATAASDRPSADPTLGSRVFAWIFSFNAPRYIGTRLDITRAQLTNNVNIPQFEEVETASPTIIGRSTDSNETTSSTTDDDTSSSPPPYLSIPSSVTSLRDRFSNFYNSSAAHVSSLSNHIRQRIIESTTTVNVSPHPNDDPTYQQLILVGGIFVGPLLFALGAFLYFLTPREFIKSRRWGLINLLMTVASVTVLILYSYNEPSVILSERIETYGSSDHIVGSLSFNGTRRPMFVSGVIKTRGTNRNETWTQVSKLEWDFKNNGSVSRWSPALPMEGQRQLQLQEKLNPLRYERVVLGKRFGWNDLANIPPSIDLGSTSSWVLGPNVDNYPVDWNTIALTNSKRKSDGIIWSESIYIIGRVLLEVHFSWGGVPSSQAIQSILGNKTNQIPKSIRLSPSNTPYIISGDNNLPLEFRGAGIRCIPRIPASETILENNTSRSKRQRRLPQKLLSNFSYFGSTSSMWSLLWRPLPGSNFHVSSQIITLPSSETEIDESLLSSTTPSSLDNSIPVSSLLTREENNRVKPPLPWVCRVALIDTTTVASIPHQSVRPQENTNWISISSIFLRVLP